MISIKELIAKDGPVYNDDILRIECGTCGEPTLSDAKCIRCIGSSIVRFGDPGRIILHSGVEREYSDDAVDLLRKISDAFCRTSAGRTDRKCMNCVLCRQSLEDEKWADLSLENLDEIIDRLGKVFLECPESQHCIEDAERYFIILREKLVKLSEEAVRVAYKIVGD